MSRFCVNGEECALKSINTTWRRLWSEWARRSHVESGVGVGEGGGRRGWEGGGGGGGGTLERTCSRVMPWTPKHAL